MARRVYTKEFKAEAVKLMTQEGYTARQASDSLGVSAHLIHRWR